MLFLEVCLYVFLLAIPTLALFTRYQDKKEFNNGVCSKCGTRLSPHEIRSDGERTYRCRDCGHTVTIFYNVDKNY